MSSTNKTTYYELPQFVDSDFFNPLVDDNDAYSKIDTALHNIASAEAGDASEIVGVKGRVTTAEEKIEALETQNGVEALTTTAQTLSGAVNELDGDVVSLDGRLDIVEDDINNVNTGLKAKVASDEARIGALETQNGNETLNTTAQTISGAVNELVSADTKLAQRIMFVTPEMYGAVGNGITDDSDALELTFANPYVKLSNKTYKVTRSITVLSNIIEGNDAKIDFLDDTWAYHVLNFTSDKYIDVKNVNIDCHDNASFAIFIGQDVDDTKIKYIHVKNCKASNMNNKVSQLSAGGVNISRRADEIVVSGCNISEVHRDSENSGVTSAHGIEVSNFDGSVEICNNIINGVYYVDTEHKYDADGIVCYSKYGNSTTAENTNATIHDNLILNCQGRSIKTQTSYVKIFNNICKNINLDVISSFRFIDVQSGSCEVAGNTMELSNCTGGGDVYAIKCGNYTSAVSAVIIDVHDNKQISDDVKMHVPFYMLIHNTLPTIISIKDNDMDNCDNAIAVYASSSITTGECTIIADGNIYKNISASLVQAVNVTSNAVGHVKVYSGNNIGSKFDLINMQHKYVYVANSVTNYAGLLGAVLDELTEEGGCTGVVVWQGSGTFMFKGEKISDTESYVMILYRGILLWAHKSAGTPTYYRIDGNVIT